MKKSILLCAAWMIAASAFADNHMAPQITYGQSYSLIVSDPAAVVEAMKTYRASPTGAQMPSTVTLSQNVANGSYQSTHTVNVFYPSAEAMAAGMALAAGSADSAEFGRRMRGVATVESENVFTMLLSRVNQEAMENPATMLFGLNVTDQAAFMKALTRLLDSEAMKAFPGNAFFGAIVAMGDTEGTHWVSFQAADVGTLLAGVDTFMKSADFAAYARNASDFREVTARLVSRQLMTMGPEG
ncbi:MAG: hypothetical protein RIC56_04855 [Pseudomonadales bacterium]